MHPPAENSAKSRSVTKLGPKGSRRSIKHGTEHANPFIPGSAPEPRVALGEEAMLDCARIVSTEGQIICLSRPALMIQPARRLALLFGANVLIVAASVWLEQVFFSDASGPNLHSPRWWFALGQAAAMGFILTTGLPDRRAAIVQALVAGISIGYTYAFVGATVVAERLAIERVELVFQAVELGWVCAAGMAIGAVTRFVARWHLAPAALASAEPAQGQYTVADLLFLMSVIGVSLGLFNLFLEEESREAQLWRIGTTVGLAVPASLPWLWAVSQNRLSVGFAVAIPLLSAGLLLFLALTENALTGNDFAAILEHAGQRTAALTIAATLNGVALRGLGFAWRRD
jgi:hypothetical protein